MGLNKLVLGYLVLVFIESLPGCMVEYRGWGGGDGDIVPDGGVDGDLEEDGDGDADSDGDLDADSDADGDCQDLDGDGFCAEEDCNDLNPYSHPGAEEVCNGADDNCNGEIDEGVTMTFYEDADGDGYGNPLSRALACAAPIGFISNSTDCNDGDPTINPGATKVCNDRVDNDCNGEVDEELGESAGCAARSCLDLHERRPGLGSEVYWAMRADGITPVYVYCDMETDGGGWTALINPVDPRLPGTHPDLEMSLAVEGYAHPGCPGAITHGTVPGWHTILAYLCGTATIALTISSTFPASDVMFLATIQGQITHAITVNGTDIPPDTSTGAYMQCVFWNSSSELAYPETNECWRTTLDSAPHLELGVLRGEELTMSLSSGPSCSPDCLHGTGMNVARLFVR